MRRIPGNDESVTALLAEYTDATILDIGNGGTVYTAVERDDCTVIPFDIERNGLSRLRDSDAVPQSYAANAVQGDAYSMPFQDGSIDVAVARGSLLGMEGTGFRDWLAADGDIIISADDTLADVAGMAAKKRVLHLRPEFDRVNEEEGYLCLEGFRGDGYAPEEMRVAQEIDIPKACQLLADADRFYEDGQRRDPEDVPVAANYESRAIQAQDARLPGSQEDGSRLRLKLQMAEEPQTLGVGAIEADIIQRDDALYFYTRNGITTACDDRDFPWDHTYDGVIEQGTIPEYLE